MKVVAFIGPTIGAAAVGEVVNAECRPPAARGDIFRAVQDGAEVIGLVDGYFEGKPAVLHKEILWALGKGVEVFGAASMGALRAAELHSYGMQGVGSIFEAYLSGEIEDDDEVAVLHGPEELGYPAVTLAMVDLRASASAAISAGVLDRDEAERFLECAKSIHYKSRTWETVLPQDAAPKVPLSPAAEEWLRRNSVTKKRHDAEEMFNAIAALASGERPSFRKEFHFEWTVAWNEFLTGAADRTAAGARSPSEALVLDEARLEPGRFADLMKEARYSWMASLLAEHMGIEPDDTMLKEEEKAHRWENSLLRRSDQEAWLKAKGLTAADYKSLLERRAKRRLLEDQADSALAHLIVEQLKLQGEFISLQERASAKDRKLKALGYEEVRPEDTGLTPIELMFWLFQERYGGKPPDEIGPFLRQLGISEKDHYYRLVAREYLFLDPDGT